MKLLTNSKNPLVTLLISGNFGHKLLQEPAYCPEKLYWKPLRTFRQIFPASNEGWTQEKIYQ
jgi:hypothetical protein